MIDLPGHGFTTSPVFWRAGPENIAHDVRLLLRQERLDPKAIIGHSAGAVAGLFLAAEESENQPLFMALNGAFRPFTGLGALIAPAVAKLAYLNPAPAFALSLAARDRDRVRTLISQTGSMLDENQITFYQRLLRYPGHVSGALHLMADWHHEGIERRLAALRRPPLLIVGTNDQAVSPRESLDLCARIEGVNCAEVEGAGHLVHEENPSRTAALIMKAAAEAELI
jgi:magnesium chelatase accessory protein